MEVREPLQLLADGAQDLVEDILLLGRIQLLRERLLRRAAFAPREGKGCVGHTGMSSGLCSALTCFPSRKAWVSAYKAFTLTDTSIAVLRLTSCSPRQERKESAGAGRERHATSSQA